MKTILRRPIITEKSIDRTRDKVYTFEVHPDASKHQVKEVVETLFSVTVEVVRMVTRSGKMKRTGRARMPKKMSDQKYALVKIDNNQTIELFGMAPEQSA